MQVAVDYTDLTTLSRRLKDRPELQKKIVPHFKQASADYFSFAYPYIPVNRKANGGNLARSIIQEFPKPLTAITGSDGSVDYAKFVYLGTRKHPITPKNKEPFVKTVTRNGKTFQQRFYHGLAFSKGGDTILRKAVMHPGTKPNPFLLRAWIAYKEKFIASITDSMYKILNMDTLKL